MTHLRYAIWNCPSVMSCGDELASNEQKVIVCTWEWKMTNKTYLKPAQVGISASLGQDLMRQEIIRASFSYDGTMRAMIPLPGKPTQDVWKTAVLSTVHPRQTALLIIDLQNDFCSDDGAVAGFGSDVSPCRTAAERVALFLPKVRGTLGLIAFFQLVYDTDKMSEAQRERLLRNGKPMICVAGSSGADLFVTPAPGDVVFTKHRYSAFSNEHFCNLLRERSITTVAVAGVDTHICVEGTVREGYDLGYRMVVLTDLVATTRSQLSRHENSLALCERYFAVTIPSHVFLKELGTRKQEIE